MCGIFGIEADRQAAYFTYLGLYALQHRGQESAGLASWNGERMLVERGMGEVADIFKPRVLNRLEGDRAIGHTRYSTSGTSVLNNAQPVVVKTSMGVLAIVHNGNLANGMEMRDRLENEGSIFQTTSDTEVILHLMARNPRTDVVDSLLLALQEVQGAYSLLLVTDQGLVAARDPNGFRPLLMGELEGAVCFASESCAFDLLGAKLVAELEPGEVVRVSRKEVERYRLPSQANPTRCAFEHVYFARPDSEIFGDAVSATRTAMGGVLAQESPADADVVVAVPDSGLFPALGYSRAAGVSMELGLIRNHYVGRTFIQPQQSDRDFAVRVKLNPVRPLIEGKRVVLVDDSIIRGTTSRKIVRMVRQAGATEVHLRICSPPTAWPCHYGIDTPSREELIAARFDVEEICEYIGADSLAYLSREGMLSCLSGDNDTYCTACWTGKYPIPISKVHPKQGQLFPISAEAREER
jgi:amidophosphoribosyltransferase